MTAKNSKTADEARIRALVDDWANALRAKDADGVASHYAADNVMFVLAPPLQYTRDNSPGKKGVEQWFSSFRGPIGYEIRDLNITAGDNVAFCHSLNRVSAEKIEGEKTDMWFRETICFRKIGHKWKITHQHESVPFYMDGSARAAIDLKP